MAFTPGSICYLDYGEAPPCIHTRLVLAALDDPNAPGDFVVCSPDLDIFVEELEAGNVDLTGFFFWCGQWYATSGSEPSAYLWFPYYEAC